MQTTEIPKLPSIQSMLEGVSLSGKKKKKLNSNDVNHYSNNNYNRGN